MEKDRLMDLARVFSEHRAFITNEETAKMALVVPFIRLLGYEPNNPREVRLEYTAEFTQGDGKRLPDRMDFAIFDKAGTKPLMVVETKPLGTNLQSNCQQLARYLAQMPSLHFGIITDGCKYLFFGDLEAPNQMDSEPFFRFSLDDPSTDWSKVAKFLSKFSRDAFNAETLLSDAEDSRYRQRMIDKLVSTFRAPNEDEAFMKWLTDDIYKGKRTSAVMARLGEIARDSIEPALLRVMTDDFLERLKDRLARLEGGREEQTGEPSTNDRTGGLTAAVGVPPPAIQSSNEKPGAETTEDELEVFGIISGLCASEGVPKEDILYRDTINYFNVSFQRPKRWFIRYFGGARRKCLVSRVSAQEARQLCPESEVEDCPPVFGVSRVYIQEVSQVWALRKIILRSLEIARAEREDTVDDSASIS